jgi:hypothetical protein
MQNHRDAIVALREGYSELVRAIFNSPNADACDESRASAYEALVQRLDAILSNWPEEDQDAKSSR